MTDGARILVVDDQDDIREVTSLILSGAGYEVETVPGGDEAIRLARRREFRLVILDINMPVMDGWKTLKILRADPGLASLPVVMFSVKGEVRDKVHGLQEGAVDYITKPFRADELLERVRRVLNSRGGGRAVDPAASSRS